MDKGHTREQVHSGKVAVPRHQADGRTDSTGLRKPPSGARIADELTRTPPKYKRARECCLVGPKFVAHVWQLARWG